MMLMGSNKHNKQPQAQQQQVSQSQPETATATSKGVHTQDTIDNIKCISSINLYTFYNTF